MIPGGRDGTAEYITPKTKKIILISVFSVHFILLVCPVIFLAVKDYFDPPLIVLKVTPVDLPINDNTETSLHPDPNNPTPNNDPQALPPDPGAVSNIPDVPDEPEPEPQKPAPQPVPEQKKIELVPVEDAKKQTRETKKTEKPKTYLKPEDIRKTNKRERDRNAEARNRAAAERARVQREAAESLRNLRAPGGSGGQVGKLADKDFLDYYAKAKSFIEPRWNRPSRDALQGQYPEVLISITVDASGRVTAARLASRSGNSAMDSSVEAMLARLDVLPVPPRAMSFTVTMRITN